MEQDHVLSSPMTDRRPLISVIVPVYQVEPCLRRCLDSIIKQSCTNLEILLIDDGSPDRSGDICDEYAAKDQRIIVIHQENRGLSAARNAGLDLATGDFILFVDSDDWIEPSACESLLKNALDLRVDLVIFGFRMVSPDGRGRSYAVQDPGIKEKAFVMEQLVRHRMNVYDAVWNKCYKRSLFDGIRFPEGREFEDLATLYRLIHAANRIYMSPAVLYHYIQRERSITTKPYGYQSHLDHMKGYEERLAFLNVFYPGLVDTQRSMMFRKILEDKRRLRNSPHAQDVRRELATFVRRHKDRLPAFAGDWVLSCLRVPVLFVKRSILKLFGRKSVKHRDYSVEKV